MILEFENSFIKDYVPYLIPTAKMVKFSDSENSVYRDSKIMEYPFVYATRDDAQPSFAPCYYHVDDDTGDSVRCFPYEQPYVLNCLVEKQQEAIEVRNTLVLNYRNNPYVSFLLDGEEVKLGLRLLETKIASDRDNYDDKGAKRVVTAMFRANLVLADMSVVPLIKEVLFRPKVKEVDSSKESVYQKIVKSLKLWQLRRR